MRKARSVVSCSFEHIDMDGDRGTVEGVRATCSRCGHTTESFGTSGASRRRCLVLLNQECPEGQDNFYADEDE